MMGQVMRHSGQSYEAGIPILTASSAKSIRRFLQYLPVNFLDHRDFLANTSAQDYKYSTLLIRI